MGSYLVVVRQDAPRTIGDDRLIGNKELLLFLSRSLTIWSTWVEEQSPNGLYLMIVACNYHITTGTGPTTPEVE